MNTRTSFIAALATTLLSALPTCHAEDGRLERILTVREVRVCIWPEYHGISYRNPRTQELSGVDSEMAQELASDLGVRLTFVDSSFARLVDDLLADRCDVAMFGVGVTPERLEKLRFTRPHLRSDVHAVTTRTNRRVRQWEDIDRPGIVVAVAKGTLHETLMPKRLARATLLVLDSPQAREQEVESGRADVFMTDYPYGRRMLETTDWARLVSPPTAFHLTSYAYAMVPGDDSWHTRMEQFVADIKRDGRLAAASARHQLEPILVSD